MKNITVSVDEEIYHKARVHAAQQRTSLSALVRSFLEDLVDGDSDFATRQREQNELIARIRVEHQGFSAGDRLARGDSHDRDALR